MSDPTYVYNGKEYRLTGRVAEKPSRASSRTNAKKNHYVEIQPIDSDPENTQFNQWVKQSDLYEITHIDK